MESDGHSSEKDTHAIETYESPFSALKDVLTQDVQKAISRRQEVYQVVSRYRKEGLESLITPSFEESSEGAHKGHLRVSFGYSNKSVDFKPALEKLDDYVTSTFRDQMVLSGHYTSVLVDNYTWLRRSGTGNKIERRLQAIDPADTDNTIFKIEYEREISPDNRINGMNFNFYISHDFASNRVLPRMLVQTIWEMLVLYEFKAVHGQVDVDETAVRATGLEFYKGTDTFDLFGGYHDVKEKLRRDMLIPLTHPEIGRRIISKTRRRMSSPTSNAIMLYGPPGTGKTSLMKAVAGEMDIPVIILKLRSIFSKYISESESRLSNILDTVEKYAQREGQVILFIDDIDFFGARTSENTGADLENRRVLDSLFSRLDGIFTDKEDVKVLYVGATNDMSLLDRAFLRRFGSKIKVGLPTRYDRAEIIPLYAAHLQKHEIDVLVNKTDGFSGMDIENMAKTAERRLIAEQYANEKTAPAIPPLQYYLDALSEIKGSGKKQTQPDIDFYR